MKVVLRVLAIVLVIGIVAGAVYAAEQALQPALVNSLGRFEGEFRRGRFEREGEAVARFSSTELAEVGEGEFRRARREAGGVFDEHFRPLAGLVGLAGNLALVGIVVGGVVIADRGLSRIRRAPSQRA